MNIIAIYDAGQTVIDRYTVYFDTIEKIENGISFHSCIGMSSLPYHALGFCQHTYGLIGSHNGLKIKMDDLPLSCQYAAYCEIVPFLITPLKAKKRKDSEWKPGFSGKKYTVISIHIETTDFYPLFVIKKPSLDQTNLIYADECTPHIYTYLPPKKEKTV